MDEAGEVVSAVNLDNDPIAIALEVAKAGPDPEVAVEATYGWYWLVDALQDAGANVRLAHSLGGRMYQHQRVKNDRRDAAHVADLLRMGRLPEAWIAPPATRELRELVRHRAKLVALRTGLRCQVHAILAKEGVTVPMSDLFGVRGTRLLDELDLAPAYDQRVRSLRELLAVDDREIDAFERDTHQALRGHAGYEAVQTIHGVGRSLAGVFVAELGDVTRFAGAPQLCSWAGLTPRHDESHTTVRRGAYHQARFATRALGGGRGRRAPTRPDEDHGGLPSHRRTTRTADRSGRRGAQGPHARLLRAARRAHPLPGRQACGGGVRRLGSQHGAS
jgi:transposase